MEHRRTPPEVLRTLGRYLDAEGLPIACDVVFWGEWEASSRVVQRWPARGRLPRALHRPYWTRPTSGGFRQNTDPWVFGDHMLYSNCKQLTGPERRPTSMQHLLAGSVICFGTTLDHEFCLDTVLVAASAEPWAPAIVTDLDVDDAFAVCTAGSIVAGGTDTHTDLTLYRGATHDHPIHGMYSFVPALPADGDVPPRFARPVIHLPGLINPGNRQSTWGSKRPPPVVEVRGAWEAVRDQVIDAGLVLAVHLDTPPEHEPAAVPASEKSTC